MQTKTLCKFSRIPQTVCRIALSAAIFTGILVVMVFALALIANGMLFFGAASLLFGLGLILLSTARLCPAAASYVYRLFSSVKE